ncbi:hypothetical protein B0H17DRAFT_1154425 [Mycena rosella]|uniref:Uncharacterized protein n=1 Tax=Mycena rosella TaxID=1033263 RepID=A0AAD7AZ43_MYCRO|nr:hypothetical protein B0H17DRAFT_1154425 [Mycena rosella]
MVSRPPSPESEESLYNDGQGLQFTVELTLLPDEKARKNAKAKVIKKNLYVHEDSAFNHLLYMAIKIFRREDDLSFSFLPRDDQYDSTTIDIPGMTYTIPKSTFKEMALTCDADYQSMLTAARKKEVPETINICMAELKPHEEGDNDEQSSDDEEAPRKEEKEDKARKDYGMPMGTHVDLKNPPDSKPFEHQQPDDDDQALIRTRATQKGTMKDNNITINLTMPETAVPAQTQPQPVPPVRQPSRPGIAPQMSLELFSQRYNLTAGIYNKLRAYSVTGPHALRYLKNNHLEDAHLNPAEIADVRDAQDRWVAGEGE